VGGALSFLRIFEAVTGNAYFHENVCGESSGNFWLNYYRFYQPSELRVQGLLLRDIITTVVE
jgi:hypothetical protein